MTPNICARRLALGLFVAAAMALSGCGHSNSSQSAAGESSARTQPAAPPASTAAATNANAPGGAGSAGGGGEPSHDLRDVLKQVHEGGEPAAGPPLPTFPPMTPAAIAAAPHLQRVKGMMVTQVDSNSAFGDYEVIEVYTSVDATGFRMVQSAQMPDASGDTGGAKKEPNKTKGKRFVSQEDIQHAPAGFGYFGEEIPEDIPGTTADALSVDIFAKLMSTGKADLQRTKPGIQGSLMVHVNVMAYGSKFWQHMEKTTCTLTRAEAQDVAYPVLLNDERVSLPAIHAKCDGADVHQDVYFLDNAQFPMNLAANSATLKDRGQVTEIRFPPPPPPPPANAPVKDQKAAGGGGGGGGGGSIAEALKNKGRADVYGIYFDFDKDVLRPESGPVLDEIAAALKANPTWKLNVNGHTDNIGGDEHNMDLSKRRAAAVVNALVTKYQIDASRLTPAGFGATQPKESNDTIQGRARNRRVELVRQ